MRISMEDILSHKLSECDRRVLAEIKALREYLDEVKTRVEDDGSTWAYGSIQRTANQLDQYLTERSTLRQVREDLAKVKEQP